MLSHFPVQLTSFVGRTRELIAVLALLREADCRLLTLLGPGGVGKTRLSLEAARQRAADLRDGAVFIPLQPVKAPEFVVHAIGAALGQTLPEGETALDPLARLLQQRQTLLVLDNMEHVLDAVPLLVTLLERAQDLQLLVTSREVLNIAGEYVYEVSGLALAPDEHLNSDAVSLFVTRALQTRSDFDAARISPHCGNLSVDGRPSFGN